MNAARLLAAAAFGVAVVALAFAIRQSHRAARIEAELEQWRSERHARADAQKDKAAAGSQAASSGGSGISAAAPEEAAAIERRIQQDIARRRAQEAKARAEAQTRLVLSPEMQQLNFTHFRSALPLRFQPLYRALTLSPEQIAQFESVMAERFWATADLTAAQRTQNISERDPAYARLKEETLAPLDAKLAALLGEAGMERYRQFEHTAAARGLVESLAGRLVATAEPLTTAQADQLTIALAAFGDRVTSEPSPDGWLREQLFGVESRGAGIPLSELAWEKAVPELQRILSPAQLELVRSLREQAELRRQAARRFQEEGLSAPR